MPSFCPDCEASLDDIPPGTPCPGCGGDRRSVNVTSPATLALTVHIPTPGISIGYPEIGVWEQKWAYIENKLTELEDIYRQTNIGNDRAVAVVEELFRLCRELADWLWHNPTGLSESTVQSFIHTNQDLRICNGFAQTTKHNVTRATKKDPDPISAHVSKFSTQPVRIEISWENQSGTQYGQEDALDLGKRCVQAWHAYLTQHGLL